MFHGFRGFVLSFTLLCCATTGSAQTPWTNPGGGFWHTGSNWAGGSPPGPGGTAIFNLPNTYNVLWNNGFGDSVNAGLVVGNDGQVTFSNTSTSTRTYTVAGTSVVNSNVINGSGTRLTVGSFPGNVMQVTSGGLLVDNGGQIIATSGGKVSTPGLITVGSNVSSIFLAIPHLNATAGGVIEASEGRLGAMAGSIGRMVVDGSGSQWNSTGSLHVGYSGNGLLYAENGGVIKTGTGFIGSAQAGADGLARVSGTGSRWENTSTLHVGYNGAGTLNVAEGGVVTNGLGIVGDLSSSSGHVTVTGSGSQWNSSESLVVGSGGTGTLNVEDGGVVNASQGISIGLSPGAMGAATVTGSGSQLNSPFGLVVGHSGAGALNVENGGVVTDTVGSIGAYTGSGYTGTGTVTVTGSGSQWNNSDVLRVGFQGAGTLNIAAGGLVTNTLGYIAQENGSVGTATVTGPGSQWNNTGLLYVGSFGNGTLNVTAGGVVTNTVGSIAQENGSISTATVTGGGSQWNNSNILVVGNNSGNGTLNVTAGGLVTNTQGFIANETTSTGSVTVNGIGSRWSNSSNLYVGHKGAGTLNVQNGGEVTNTNANIGLHVGTSGVATVTGAGSKWTNSEYLVVGSNGNGTLNVLAGGAVTNTDSVIGFVPGSVGTALVTGANSKWTNSGFLIVGNSGNGTLNVEAGGAVTNTDAAIGKDPGSTSAATVTGAGSKWTHSGFLAVGQSGTGTLNVQNGGVVTNSGWGYVGSEPGSVGTATVTGSGSQWNNNDSLEVGRFGTGTLNIADGGSVSVVNLTVVDVDGQINNSNSNFVSNTVINQPGGEIVGNGSFTANAGWSNFGLMAFRGGVSNVYGDITNQPGGRIFGEFFGQTIVHGNVVHNGAQIAVGTGSTIEFQGSVTGAGNYFSGGVVIMSGGFRPGNGAGAVSVASNLTLAAGNTTYMELGGVAPGAFDRLLIGNALTLGGALDVSLLGGYVPTAGATFDLFDWGTRTGTFSTLTLPTLGGGLAWNTSLLYTTGMISVGLAGDFDHDGDVDGRDFLIWQRGGSPSPLSPGDLADWQANYATGGLSAISTTVPEPAGAIAVCLALFCCFCRPRGQCR